MEIKQPTKKQIDILMKNGFTYEQVSNMPYADISAKIGEILGNPVNNPTQFKKSYPMPVSASKTPITESNSVQIIRNERANSYEFGKAGNRFKIYFEDAKDLRIKIMDLKAFDFEVSDLPTEKIE